jgi:outer membrane protein OmpA-like peptidoglycan-associated protein
MRTSRSLLAGVALSMLAVAAGCRGPKVNAPPAHAELVVLLPDPESGAVGAATVTANSGGTVHLTRAGEGTRVAQGKPPTAPAALSPDDIQRLFGTALAARPIAPRQFILYFQAGSELLTAQSRALVPQIIADMQARPAPDLTVIGHTDTTSDRASNMQLGMQRARVVRDLLVASGLDASQVDIASHGERNLLVPTPDNTPEPKNRRVEVTIR